MRALWVNPREPLALGEKQAACIGKTAFVSFAGLEVLKSNHAAIGLVARADGANLEQITVYITAASFADGERLVDDFHFCLRP